MFFKGQVSTDTYLLAIFFVACAAAAFLATLGLPFIDSGLSRRENVVDSWVQKLVASGQARPGPARGRTPPPEPVRS
jgi:hypothetical protein